MNRYSSRQIMALLLGVIVALGMTLSAVQANDMAIKMAMPADMGGCDDCGNGSDGDRFVSACSTVCMTPVQAILAPAIPAIVAATPNLSLPIYWPTHGPALSPDPNPPKSLDLS